MVEHLSYADLIMNETPESPRLLKSLLCRYGRMDLVARVKYVPHPVFFSRKWRAEVSREVITAQVVDATNNVIRRFVSRISCDAEIINQTEAQE